MLDLGDGEMITMLYLLIKDLELNHMYLLSFFTCLIVGTRFPTRNKHEEERVYFGSQLAGTAVLCD